MTTILHKVAASASTDEKINGAAFRDQMIAIGILIDKITGMTGVSSEVQAQAHRIQIKCERLGWDVMDVLADVDHALDMRLDDEAATRRARDTTATLTAGDTIDAGAPSADDTA